MKTGITGWLLAAGLLVNGAALAADVEMEPGLWSWSSEMSMPGMKMQVPAMVHKECITRDNMIPSNRDTSGECDIKELQVTRKRVTWSMVCRAPEGETRGRGVMNYAGDKANGEMQFETQGMEMTLKMTGHRLGDCP